MEMLKGYILALSNDFYGLEKPDFTETICVYKHPVE